MLKLVSIINSNSFLPQALIIFVFIQCEDYLIQAIVIPSVALSIRYLKGG